MEFIEKLDRQETTTGRQSIGFVFQLNFSLIWFLLNLVKKTIFLHHIRHRMSNKNEKMCFTHDLMWNVWIDSDMSLGKSFISSGILLIVFPGVLFFYIYRFVLSLKSAFRSTINANTKPWTYLNSSKHDHVHYLFRIFLFNHCFDFYSDKLFLIKRRIIISLKSVQQIYSVR